MKKKELTIREVASMGGKARGKLPKERLTELGRHAVNVRWEKYRKAVDNSIDPTSK